MEISQTVTLDIATGAATVGSMIFMQRESEGRQLEFTVLNAGAAYALTGFADKIIVIEKPDGEIIYNNLTDVTKNTAKYTFTSQSQIVNGLLRCWLKFKLGDQIVVTPEFHIRVNEVADFDSAVESTSEFGVLDSLIKDASAAVDECNKATDEMNDMTASFENATASATTLAEGESATVSLTDGEVGKVFAFGIPKGDTGAKGNKGDKGDKGDTGEVSEVELSDAIVKGASSNIVRGKNLFNLDTATLGYYVSNLNGALAANAIYAASDYIMVAGSTQYTASTGYRMAYYDAGKKFISGLTFADSPGSPRTYTTPANAMYVRLTALLSQIESFQFELGASSTTYEPHKNTIGGNVFTRGVFEQGQLLIAPILWCVVGHEVNVYTKNISTYPDDYDVDYVCTLGTQQVERWTYVPEAADVGTVSFVVNVYKNGVLLDTKTSSLIVLAADVGTGETLKVQIIGDSTTANNTMINELANVVGADALTVEFIGTQGVAPNFHEGYSGKSVAWMYSDAASPFVYSSAFNYASYLTSHSLDTPDVVIFNLGINDLFSQTTDAACDITITAIKTQYDAMIANIKASNANVIIGVCLTIPSGNQDAFGSSYDSGQTSARYRRNNRRLVKALIDYYTGKTAQNIYLVPLNACLDTNNNMLMGSAVPVNSRNPTTVTRQINGVHPGVYGYYQIADAIFYWIKGIV